MRLDSNARDVVEVTLSERNLRSLLAKLEGAPVISAYTIVKQEDDTLLILHAERDDEHYGRRGYGPGPMHPETEAAL